MDDTDKKILDLIKGNARMSYQEIGDNIGMSRVAAKKRIVRLEKDGIIRGYSTYIDRSDEITMLFDITTTKESFDEILEYVGTKTVNVRQIFTSLGENHIHMVAVSDSLNTLRYLARMIRKDCGEGILDFQMHQISEVVKDVYGNKSYDDYRRSRDLPDTVTKDLVSTVEADEMENTVELIRRKIDDNDFIYWIYRRHGNFKFPVYQGMASMDKGIDCLDLSPRAYNCLKRCGYNSINSLVSDITGREDLKKIRNMGQKSADEVMLKLFLYTYDNLSPDKKEKYLKRTKEMN